MNTIKSFQQALGKISDSEFDNHAIALFRFQAENNSIYRAYIKSLNIDLDTITVIDQIPFLPISFFNYQTIKTNDWPTEIVFESSGTTQLVTSKHHLPETDFYHSHAQQLFEEQFGTLKGKTVIGLLPSYLERKGSSLVSMVQYFIEESGSDKSGFYLDNIDEMIELMVSLESTDEVYLFGVTFALLDLARQHHLDFRHVTIIETGGMKGRREELLKEELYDLLTERLAVDKIYSEYGMTELLSQVYGERGIFKPISSMKVLIRDINDPFTLLPTGRTGGINIIDLANAHSCSFIETKDLGRVNEDNSFEILGRFDNSDLRGCNLLVE